jgi:hypothetical protein
VAYLEACLPRCARDAPLVAAYACARCKARPRRRAPVALGGILPGVAAVDAVIRGVPSRALEPASFV